MVFAHSCAAVAAEEVNRPPERLPERFLSSYPYNPLALWPGGFLLCLVSLQEIPGGFIEQACDCPVQVQGEVFQILHQIRVEANSGKFLDGLFFRGHRELVTGSMGHVKYST